MPIELYWDNDEQTVLLCEFGTSWNWDELRRVLAAIHKLTAATETEIAAIVDVRQGIQIPLGEIFSATGLANAKSLLTMGESGTGPVVIVGMNGIIRKIYDILYKLDPRALAKVHMTDNLKQARALLAKGAAHPIL